MKKIILILLCAFATGAFGQSYPNSWIDYNKTYYKFQVPSTGLYRIPYSVLNGMGLGSTPAEQFQLWRNGVQVPLYTTVPTGTLGATDFIEFWGIMNDGTADTKLYRDPDYQLSNFYSLETDTATYFLTVNPSGGNLRFTDAPNNVSGNSLPAEPYFMNSRSAIFKTQINGGLAYNLGEYVYSSSYDIAEGWASNDIAPGTTYALYYSFDTLNMYPGGPPSSFYFAVAGNAINSRSMSLRFYNNVIDSEDMSNYTYVKKLVTNIPASDFPNTNQLAVSLVNNCTNPNDRMVASILTLTYPSTFNFNNQNSYFFRLPATSTGNYLVINNFNYGTQKPVLLDLSDNLRYTGDDSSLPGKVQFVLPPSSLASRQFELVSEDPSAISTITTLTKRNFINYGLPANQGDYLIISNSVLYDNGSGINYVDQYRAYRSSTPGGSYDAKIYNMDQLTDQFGYGIKNYPGAIRDFIQYAYNTFSPKPQYVLLVGKGITYDQYRRNRNSIYDDKLELVPTFGSPASDVLLAAPYGSDVPSVPIGRLSVVNGNEIGNYLQKVKEYEQAQTSNIQTEAQKLWMKNIVEVSGGSDSTETSLFNFYLGQYGAILKDTLFGGSVYSFSKTSNSAIQLLSNQQIQSLFNNGIGILSYFGHSSANQLAFNLSDPTTYNNQGRYPFFFVSGCTAGNNYIFDTTRITQSNLSISENFVLAPERGSIGFFASSHLGVPPYLFTYDIDLYKQIGVLNYGNTIGNDIKNTILALGGSNYAMDFLSRCNLEELNLHGDPAIRINPQPKPDYVIEDPDVVINPAFISIAQSSFKLKATSYNLGKAVKDSITFQVKRTYPNGTSEVIYRKRIRGIQYADSINITIPIVPSRDKGDNKITVTIDADNNVDEMSETNNSITKDVYIYEDEATPSYPYNYAIINSGNQKLYASTANPASTAQDYVMEIDTTEQFNSPSMVTRSLNSSGGVLEFDPGFTYTDSTVYYWRVALKPVSGQPSDYHWNTSSFIYLPNSSLGSNQSHYYQHLHSDTSRIRLDSASRQWKYDIVNNIINFRNGVFPTAASLATDFQGDVNGAAFVESVCGVSGIIFNVLDPVSLKPWMNVMGGTSGLYGSDPVCATNRLANFQFNLLDSNKRKAAARFLLDSIPNNYIVIVRNISGTDSTSNTYAPTWDADSTSLGASGTMYYALKSQGFVLIDSFYRPRSFIFMYQKNNPAFNPEFIFSNGIYDKISLSHNFLAPDSLGYVTSPVFGPAQNWKQLHWRGYSLEPNSPDNPTVQVIGIDSSGNSS
ncbi:MAG: hypothetical protein KGM98_09930, partial [Bacteroidota bacterium]|nr:hypothetical protein [Bacteroidota bacterium]